VIVRTSVETFAATVTSTLPPPEPDVAENDTSGDVPAEAVHPEGLQPAGVAMIVTCCRPPVGGAATAAGAIYNVQADTGVG
jgi:hypothetical protein